MSSEQRAIARPRTFLHLVLDESSSMTDVHAETVTAVNRFLATQRGNRIDELFVSLTKFNDYDNIRTVFCGKPITDVRDLTHGDFQPGGLTALYDGILAAIEQTDRDKNVGKSDRVLIVTITDGDENHSRKVRGAPQMREIVQRYRNRGNWTFVLLSASGSATQTGSDMGMAPDNVRDFTVQDVGTALQRVSTQVSNYRATDDLQTDTFYTQAAKFRRTAWARGAADDEAQP